MNFSYRFDGTTFHLLANDIEFGTTHDLAMAETWLSLRVTRGEEEGRRVTATPNEPWQLTITERKALLTGPFGYYECAAAAWQVQYAKGRSTLVARISDVYDGEPIDDLRRALDMPTHALAVMVGEWDGQGER